MTSRAHLLPLAAALVACAKTPSAPEAAPAQEPASVAAVPPTTEGFPNLESVVAAPHRVDDQARDPARKPVETLNFCGLQPDHTVIELSPGGGWYTKILAPYLRDEGVYAGAAPSPDGERARYYERYAQVIGSDESLFGKARTLVLDPPDTIMLGPSNTADLILTFRNSHSWVRDGLAEQTYAAAFDALKPGGTFCVVQHRASEDTEVDAPELAKTGYVKQSHLIAIAESVGFQLDEASELHANPRDTRDHPKGVWTLPPTLALGDEDKSRYLDIGESDRMTLRFTKPVAEPSAE